MIGTYALGFCVYLLIAYAALANTEKISFEVEAGEARDTLKLAAEQSDIDLMFNTSIVENVQTENIQGEYTIPEAFSKLLRNTGLALYKDTASSTYAIIQIQGSSETEHIGSDSHYPHNDNNPEMTTSNNRPTIMNRFTRGLVSLLAIGAATTAIAQDDLEDENIFLLSPFVIDASEDDGYVANTTLAGTRLKTNLADIGSSITAVTEQFMEDTGSTNVNDLFIYTANTETASVGGNFSAGFEQSDAFGRGFQSGSTSITNPQSAQRVRGLASADTTRNLFRSSLPWDNYNIDRVEIVRGAQSILFGQGSAGGIVNVNLKKAFFRDAHEIQVRFDENESLRTTFDSNVVLIDDKLAIRVAGLRDRFNFRQDPAYEDDDRLFATATWKINDNLTFRVNGEAGSIRANRANPFGPTDGFSFYLDQLGTATYPIVTSGQEIPRIDVAPIPEVGFAGQTDQVPANTPRIFVQYGLNLNADGSLAGNTPAEYSTRWTLGSNTIQNGNPAGIPRSGRTHRFTRTDYEVSRGIGLIPQSLEDYSIFDWKNNHLAGNYPYQDEDFQAFNTALEYISDEGHFGAEFTYDIQLRDRDFNAGPTGSRDYIIRLDVTEDTFDGSGANPNVLRPSMTLTQNQNAGTIQKEVREAAQLTAFARYDFVNDAGLDNWLGRILGNHTLTLYGSRAATRFDSRGFDETWEGENIARNASNGLNPNRPFGHPHRDVGANVYLGPSISSIDDISITPLQFSARDYFPDGQTYTLRVWDKASQTFRDIEHTATTHITGISDTEQVIETMAFILQSNLLDDHIITTLGYREDTVTETTAQFGIVDGTNGVRNPSDITDIILDEGDDGYFSWSVVAKSPRNWDLPFGTNFSVFYNESENFNPADTGRVDALVRPIDPTTGTTKDYGFRINTFNDKLQIKWNFFESSLEGQTFNPGGLIRVAIIEIDTRFREFTVLPGVDTGYLDPNDPNLAAWGSPPPAVVDEVNIRLDDSGEIFLFDGTGRITDTTDTSAEGMEIEVVWNPISELRIIANAARQETTRTNSMQGLQDYLALRLPDWQNAFDYPRGQVSDERLEELGWEPGELLDIAAFAAAYPNNTVGGDYDSRIRIPLQAILDQDGGVVDEQREWRANVIANWTFANDSKFSGFNVGGALRWQDKAAIGNPFTFNDDGQLITDVNNPFFGPDETNFDAWVGYKRKILDGKVDWKIQLNIRNLFADDDPIPVTIDAYGNPAQLRLPALQYWYVTNTFSF